MTALGFNLGPLYGWQVGRPESIAGIDTTRSDMQIQPTIGRVVWYRPEGPFGPIQAAIVCGVNSDTSVNLHVFSMYGQSSPGHCDVHLKQEPEETPPAPYCEWMPYQVDQAIKHQRAEPRTSKDFTE